MKTYDHIYLSPHLDDAALSCGGQIFTATSAGQSVLIVTITAVDAPADDLSDFAAQLHARWESSAAGLDAAGLDAVGLDAVGVIAQRRAEDALAARILGADVLHWPYFDCIYRRHPATAAPLYDSTAALFGPVDPAEDGLVDELTGALSTLPEGARVFAPLGVGNHVDHQITRAAAERAYGRALWYYEDYPYTAIPGALEAALPEGERDQWAEETILLGEAVVEAKIAAIMAFKSQLSSFFAGPDDLARRVREEGQRVLGSVRAQAESGVPYPAAERVWRRR
jgi:LmbE family N-acetylglucosaminyl deacetylase